VGATMIVCVKAAAPCAGGVGGCSPLPVSEGGAIPPPPNLAWHICSGHGYSCTMVFGSLTCIHESRSVTFPSEPEPC
jgi:hypothetical protein